MIPELTNYEQWQLEKYGFVLLQPIVLPDGFMETGEEEMRRFAEWNHDMAERELYEHEQD